LPLLAVASLPPPPKPPPCQELTELQAQLLRERERHDDTKAQLHAVQQRVAALEAAAPGVSAAAIAGAGGGAGAGVGAAGAETKRTPMKAARSRAAGAAAVATTPRTGGAAGVGAGGRAAKRSRRDVEGSEDGAEPMEVEGGGAGPSAPPPARTPRTAGTRTPSVARRRSAAATTPGAPTETPATPSTGGRGGSPVVLSGDLTGAVAALPGDVSSMSVAALKGWVTQYRLEDNAYMQLAANGRAKKSDWVKYVKQRAGLV
jgi:hypothetical protein